MHDRADAAVTHGGLEGEEERVVQLASPDVGRRLVEPALGQAVADHVLGGRDDRLRALSAGLDAPHVRAAQDRLEVLILPVRLFQPAPARIARDVQHGREGLAGAGRAQVPADDGRATLLDQGGIPVGGLADRLRESTWHREP